MSTQSSTGLPELWVPNLTVTDSADFEHLHLRISIGLDSILTGARCCCRGTESVEHLLPHPQLKEAL